MKITFCGSSKFHKYMEEVANQLSKNGHECFLPEPLVDEADYEKEHGKKKLLEMKPFWTKRHFKRIENSDAILIFNRDRKGFKGYFGSNTLIELSVAFYLDKKIFLLNQIEEDHPHYEEVIGLNTTTLDEDLEKVK